MTDPVVKYWLSCPRFTIQVNVQNGLIVWTAPIARKFIGQPAINLTRWSKCDQLVILNRDELGLDEENLVVRPK